MSRHRSHLIQLRQRQPENYSIRTAAATQRIRDYAIAQRKKSSLHILHLSKRRIIFIEYHISLSLIHYHTPKYHRHNSRQHETEQPIYAEKQPKFAVIFSCCKITIKKFFAKYLVESKKPCTFASLLRDNTAASDTITANPAVPSIARFASSVGRAQHF